MSDELKHLTSDLKNVRAGLEAIAKTARIMRLPGSQQEISKAILHIESVLTEIELGVEPEFVPWKASIVDAGDR